MKRIFNKNVAILAVVCILIGSIAGAALFPKASAEQKVVTTSPFTEAINKVHSSVVGVNNYSTQNTNPYGNFGFGFGFFDSHGYDNPNTQEVLYGAGSGVVVSKGYVVTNYHVIENSTRLTVVAGEKEYDAELVAYDELKDVAVLHAKDLPLEPVTMGDSDKLVIGDWAIAIGNPVSLPGTTTVGVISSPARKIITNNSTDMYGKRTNHYSTMIQTDAAINSGNSGGGLFNTNGELIGIPTLKYTNRGNYTNGQIDGIGFAIPVNEVKEIINEAISGNGKKVRIEDAQDDNGMLSKEPKPRMGITIADINANSAAVANGSIPKGVLIKEVESNSPANVAGLKPYDVIVEADGKIIKSTSELMELMATKKADDTVQLKVYRVPNLENYKGTEQLPEGEYLTFDVKLAVLDKTKQ